MPRHLSVLLCIGLAQCGHAAEPAPTVATITTAAPPPPHETTATPSAPPPEDPTPVTTASTADDPPDPAPASSSSIIVERSVWIDAFEAALPVALCQAGSYFRSCFAVTPTMCEQTAASATRVCLDKVRKQLPSKFHQPDEGTAWGRKIGACVGTSYEVTLSRSKIASQKCSDASAWTSPP